MFSGESPGGPGKRPWIQFLATFTDFHFPLPLLSLITDLYFQLSKMLWNNCLFCGTLTLPVGLEDLRFLDYELRPVSHMWYSLGVQLQIPIGTLKRIESDYHNKATRCLLEMLTVWLQRANPSPTWSVLIETLESVDERRLAQELGDKYCPETEGGVTHEYHTQGPPSSGALPTPQGNSLSVPSTVMICGCVMCVDCYVTVYAVRW